MDFYLKPGNSRQRLLEEYKRYGSLVIAFDFDDAVYDFHKKGRSYTDVVKLLRVLKSKSCFLICWTGQDDLGFVADYLEQYGIPFDRINENPPFKQSPGKKIYANAYLDDRAGLSQVYKELQYLMQKI